MIDRYLECATDEELERVNTALFEARAAELRAARGLAADAPLDHRAGGAPAEQVTRRYTTPIVDADGVLPGGLLPLDARAATYQGSKVEIDDTAGGKSEVTIDVADAKPKEALAPPWKDKLEGKSAGGDLSVKTDSGSETVNRGGRTT